MSKKIVILFTCVGRRVSLVEAFRRACRRLGCQGVIVGADTTEASAALQCCDRKYLVKPVSDRGYARQIKNIIQREGVDLLIPTVDLDLSIWAAQRRALKRLGCTAVISSPRVVHICQDKRLMFRFLKEHGFQTPHTMSVGEALKQRGLAYPLFLKPWDGHASKGNAIVRSREELLFYARRIPNCMVQYFIAGDEYTVDVFVDFGGKVRCVVPRRRLETRAGEVNKGMTAKHPEIMRQAQALVETLGAGPGVITLQCFLTAGNEIYFIEINPRFGGGAPLSIKAGADFPRWLLGLWLGGNPRIRPAGWRDRLLMLRYDEAIWRQM
jgi:carbamoyl-phosphate synthase large subunit